jgi:ribosomal protein L7/L12
MKHRYSKQLIQQAVDFIRAAKEELGEQLGEERANAMLDAFDPSLKHQILMQIIMGTATAAVRVRRNPAVPDREKQKINAIRHIRGITGLGLKQAKDVTDHADSGLISKVPGSWSMAQREELGRNLAGTGYELV